MSLCNTFAVPTLVKILHFTSVYCTVSSIKVAAVTLYCSSFAGFWGFCVLLPAALYSLHFDDDGHDDDDDDDMD